MKTITICHRPPLYSRQQIRELNRLIDSSLQEPEKEQVSTMIDIAGADNFQALAERIRRRSASLIKRQSTGTQRTILDTRDRLMQLVYAGAAPNGCYCAWSDASRKKEDGDYTARIGGLLMDPERCIVAEISQPVSDRPIFEAEIAALAAILEAGLEHRADCLIAHTDCDALVSLWLRERDDPRLLKIRQIASQYKKILLRSIPRLHNQPANFLAKGVGGK